jgi:cell division protein FtsA
MEGCKLLRPQAEKLKVAFGSALPAETHENEIISIPGIAGRDRKEISMRTLAHVINARMEEIFAQVYFEIKSSGYANSLNAGVVVTGGGSQLKHLKQLVEYTTGLSTRIGYPSSYLAKNNKDDLKNPMYATGIGLLLKGYEQVEEMTETEKRKLFSVQQDEVVVEGTAPQIETETRTVYEEEVIEDFEKEEAPKNKKGNLLQQVFSSVKNWFEVDNINGDFN